MLPGRVYRPADIIDLVIRFKWLILVPWVVVGIGVFMYARTLQDYYRAESLLQVVAQRVPQNLVRSTITAGIEERLPVITQNILSRTRLERVINDFGLYAEERRNGQLMEDLVAQMRNSHIEVAPVKGDAFRIRFTSTDPRLAHRVTERLATLFVEENLRDREAQAENTNQFLDSQLDEARRRLQESEKKVEDYKREHRSELPSQLSTNLQSLQNLEQRRQQIIEASLRDREQRFAFDKQIAEIEAQLVALEQAALSEPGLPESALPAAAQVLQAESRIAQMRLTLKENHPDMDRANRALRELRAKAAQEALQMPVSNTGRGRSPVEVQARRRIADLREEMAKIDKTTASRAEELKRLQRSIAEVESRVDAAPTRESEMIAITRDYQTLASQYTSLLLKSEDAKIASNLERRQIGEQFKIIDAARLPERPFSPDRTIYNLGGMAGGLVLGLALVGLIEFKDSSFRNDQDIVAVLSLPVLATIPQIVTREDRRARRRRRKLLMMAAAVVVAIGIGVVLVWRLGLLQRIF